MGKGVAGIIAWIAGVAAAIHVQDLVTQLRVGNMTLDDLFGHAGVQGIAIGFLIRNLTMQKIHRSTSRRADVRAALGHVGRVATGTRIDFEELVGAVARIVFNIEVAKTAIAKRVGKSAWRPG